MTASAAMVPVDVVEATITSLTKIDESGDKRSMNRMARRLGKEQPALLRYAASLKEKHGDAVGEAAVFYGTLVWAIFDRHRDRAPRLTQQNLTDAEAAVGQEREAAGDLAGRPIGERVPPALVERQPHIYARLADLLAEDVSSAAMTEECAGLIFPPTQVIVEAFDAAI